MLRGPLGARLWGIAGGALCVLAFAGVAADQSVAACTNAGFVGFEPYLAGCGAFERVSPPFKAGSVASAKAIAHDGSRVVSESTGLFAGSQGGRLTADYESVRSDSGWSTFALDPASSLFPAQELIDVSADLGRSLWEVRRASESLAAENLAIREPDGSFVEVGAMLPPSATTGPPAGEAQQFADDSSSLFYVGATTDLSRIFFQVQELLWPEDTTQPLNQVRSLYEYVGAGNATPNLVGVDSNGELISNCGTALGSMHGNEYGADVYNAVSEAGETTFFTAAGSGRNGCEDPHAPAANELFARVGTRTVGISEPSTSDCAQCQLSPVADAEFQGAASDGSKGFFLTSQELFKGATGGNLYEYDSVNRPGHKIIRVSTGSPEPKVQGVMRVSEDGSHVYFVAQGVLTEGPNAEGDEPVAGGDNLYLFERDETYPSGRVTFIATLSASDSASAFRGDWARRDNRPVQATPDGRFLVFQSAADLTTGDHSAVPQVFEYDALREQLVRVSVGEPGYAAGAIAAEEAGGLIPVQEYVNAAKPFRSSTGLAVSDDGSVVEFESTGGLTAQTAGAGAQGLTSVFEYRSTGGVISNGRVYSVSNGSESSFAIGSKQVSAIARGTDATGTDAFFESVSPVVASDGDTQVDLLDARDGGGFLAVPSLSDCELEKGSSCQGGLPGAPGLLGAGSGSVVGSAVAPSSTPPPGASHPAGLSRAQKLTKALKTCTRRVRQGRARRACERSARRRYGPIKGKARRESR